MTRLRTILLPDVHAVDRLLFAEEKDMTKGDRAAHS
jgi:hypothetical protein